MRVLVCLRMVRSGVVGRRLREVVVRRSSNSRGVALNGGVGWRLKGGEKLDNDDISLYKLRRQDSSGLVREVVVMTVRQG